MRSVKKPTVKVREVFSATVSTVADATLKKKLESCADVIDVAELDFDDKFPKHEIHLIKQEEIVSGDISKKEMKTVYDYRMVKIEPGKKYYSDIKKSAAYGRCPLCSVREVDTLDHYLPKALYPIFAVTPINLIPSCFKCNKGKLVDYPKSPEEQTLHPYYDNIENQLWIKAIVLQSNPISFNFEINAPTGAPQILIDRVTNHFKSFNLNELFTSHANEELRGIKNQLIEMYNCSPINLEDYLKDCYKSRLNLGINSWQALMYRALAEDKWFCNAGILTL